MKNKNTYIIAEIAQAHDGSLGMIHSYIDALKPTGVNAVKFQFHSADHESSIHEKFRVPFSVQDKSRYEYWKRMEFTLEQWFGIKKHCDQMGIDFICSVFSNYSIDILEKINNKIYKIPSGELSNFLMLNKLSKLNKKTILSTGLSDFKEIGEAVNILKNKSKEIMLMQCTTEYPTKPNDIGLENINILKKKYNLKVGLSDHSGTIYPSLSAITLGADLIEVHAAFDKRMFGPDTSSSLTISEIKTIVEGSQFINQSLSKNKNKNSITSSIKRNRNIFGRSIIANKKLREGHIITTEDIDSIKPSGYGLSPKQYLKITNKKLLKDKNKNDFLSLSDVI